MASTLSYGVLENVDLVFSLPYHWGKTEINDETAYDEKVISDAVLEGSLGTEYSLLAGIALRF